MLFVMILSLVAILAAAVFLVLASMCALARWVHLLAAVFVGAITASYALFLIIRGWLICSADPVYHPPRSDEFGEGRMEFACDSAGGIVDYLFIGLLAPMVSVLFTVLSIRYFRIWQRTA